MMLREELQGVLTPPDKFADPIGYFEWFEANKCPDCDGTGWHHPKSCKELDHWAPAECQTCGGKGTIEEQFDPDF